MLNSKIINFKLIIYADFKSILMSADDEKQNPEEPCTNKHKKHIACSVFFHNKFSRPFKTQLGKDYVYNFINSMMK